MRRQRRDCGSLFFAAELRRPLKKPLNRNEKRLSATKKGDADRLVSFFFEMGGGGGGGGEKAGSGRQQTVQERLPLQPSRPHQPADCGRAGKRVVVRSAAVGKGRRPTTPFAVEFSFTPPSSTTTTREKKLREVAVIVEKTEEKNGSGGRGGRRRTRDIPLTGRDLLKRRRRTATVGPESSNLWLLLMLLELLSIIINQRSQQILLG